MPPDGTKVMGNRSSLRTKVLQPFLFVSGGEAVDCAKAQHSHRDGSRLGARDVAGGLLN
jgi:hypothetical protein